MSHGSLWVARPEAAGGDGILVRLDPRTGHVQRLFRALPGTYDLASELDGTVWSGGTFGEVNRIDPVTLAMGENRPMIARELTILPKPDSPITATVCPRTTE